MIEIEKRGPLTKQQFQDFQKFLSENAMLIGKYNQVGIFTTFKNEQNKNQINISISQNLIENSTTTRLKAKLGDLKDTARQELSLPFELKNINSIFDFLRMFGVVNGCPRFYYREDYKYKDLTISIKNQGLLTDHFEVEIELDDESAKLQAEKQIEDFITEIKLVLWTEDEYKALITKVFEENPPVDFDTIDLSMLKE